MVTQFPQYAGREILQECAETTGLVPGMHLVHPSIMQDQFVALLTSCPNVIISTGPVKWRAATYGCQIGR